MTDDRERNPLTFPEGLTMTSLPRASCLSAACCLLALVGGPSRQGLAGDRPDSKARDAIVRGLAFLDADAARWRKERTCATCHHGTMTVWVLSEARQRGYPVSPEHLKDVTDWSKERLANLDKPRDSRPGYNMVSTPAVYLALVAEAVPGQGVVSASERDRIAAHLLRHQESDGSWAWSLAPRKNAPPPVFESDEIVTMMAETALAAQTSAEARAGLDRARRWLRARKPAASTQAAAIRLFRDLRGAESAADLKPGIEQLLALQKPDGGWGQEKDLASDAYATGQALYFLSIVGVPADHPAIRKGVGFLVANQKPDGSWPMKSRAHPGEKPMTNPVPITHFGSAWAALGLMRSLPAWTAAH